ncbi:MAG: VCBS repeat-containing protein [Gemmatimonadaceae bacterium]
MRFLALLPQIPHTMTWFARTQQVRTLQAPVPRAGRAALLLPLLLAAGCGRGGERPLFKLLGADQTGVTFANTITTSDSLNVQTDVYVYNGAGVAVGDVDNDGLPDIFFAGNMVSSRLYLNKGQMRFDDITTQAGVTTNRWATGVSMVDINSDGYLDIYVSVSGPEWSKPEQRANLLFINNRNKTFTESAAQYGLADRGFGTHAAFLDYDGDGCLDMFLLNNAPSDFTRGDVASTPIGIEGRTPDSYNQLYRNSCQGTFTNVSTDAGILRSAGYGLGVAVADVNEDGRPDIYVSNDVVTNDVLYVNNGNGTFTNKAGQWLKHTSFAGMGVDIADFNDDGWPDILQVDMMPRALGRRKRTTGYITHNAQLESRSRGFRDDYSVNALQLSSGVDAKGGIAFSQISRIAGVSHTDWSWAALFADFDNDGLKDIFIGNGYPKAVNDLDYMTTTQAARKPGLANAMHRAGLSNLKALPTYEEPNYLFRNAGDLTFTDKTAAWGLGKPSFSYGAAYADLNLDGKLDLVVSNIDAPASIYQNVQPSDDAHHSLRVALDGAAPNRRGIGATLILSAGGKRQYLYQSPYRGYMSTVEDRLQFGLGRLTRADTLEVIWPDGRSQVLTGLEADRVVTVKQSNAVARTQSGIVPDAPTAERWFEPLGAERALAYKHVTANTADYNIQSLLPYMLSRHGPPLAVGDVNGDSLTDVFVGGGAGVPGQLFTQRRSGGFVAFSQGQPWEGDKTFEDWGALFFDANGDGRPDLFVASGGYQTSVGSPLLRDRLYLNRGGGRFVRDSQALPPMLTSTATVRAGDFTGDGKPDLFVGGRLVPRQYPYPTRSYILRNEGGRFTDVTAQVAPELAQAAGMITDAAWIDFDGDGHLDLVTVGEWMPIQFYRNEGGRLRNVTTSTKLPRMRGWWSSLATGDFDKDGRQDLIVGNLGLNHTYTTSKDSTFGIYASNFSEGQGTDVVLVQRIDGIEYPFAGMVPMGREIYQLALKFPSYGSFADASVTQLFGTEKLKSALHYEADTFASVYLHNVGGGAFTSSPLPMLAQISPIRAILPFDVDGDGNLDVLVAGNLFDTEPNTPKADAGNGLWLRGDGKGHFTPVSPRPSGFLAPRNVAGMALIGTPSGRAVLIANTGDSLQMYSIRPR